MQIPRFITLLPLATQAINQSSHKKLFPFQTMKTKKINPSMPLFYLKIKENAFYSAPWIASVPLEKSLASDENSVNQKYIPVLDLPKSSKDTKQF